MHDVIAIENLLQGPYNSRVWRDTVQNVYEKEDLWDLLEPEEENLENERESRLINEGPH